MWPVNRLSRWPVDVCRGLLTSGVAFDSLCRSPVCPSWKLMDHGSGRQATLLGDRSTTGHAEDTKWATYQGRLLCRQVAAWPVHWLCGLSTFFLACHIPCPLLTWTNPPFFIYIPSPEKSDDDEVHRQVQNEGPLQKRL